MSDNYFKDSELSINVFEKKYKVFKDETYEKAIDRVTSNIAKMERYDSNKEELVNDHGLKEKEEYWKHKWYDEIINDIWKPAGSIMAGVGNPIKAISTENCTTVAINGDSLEDIADARYKVMKFAAYRQGIGVDFSPLRPSGAKVMNSAKVSNGGALNWMEDFNEVARHIGQNSRIPALLFSLHDTHPDFPEFITLKSDLTKIENANISVQISDAFMRAVRNNEDWDMTFKTPHETIIRKEKARELYNKLLHNNLEYAEPGIQFRDTIHEYSNSDYVGIPVVSSNACFTGDMQLLTKDGYKRFDELVKLKFADIVNKDKQVVVARIWYSGKKECVRLEVKYKDEIKYIECTPDQLFMSPSGREIEAKDMLNNNMIDENGYISFVTSVEHIGKKHVYDFSEPLSHWGIVNGFVAHNCSEKMLDPSGACNLASFNLEKFPTDELSLDKFLDKHMGSLVRFLDNVIDYEEYTKRNPIEEQKESQRKLRRLGIGFTNLHAWLLKAGVDYGSEESIKMADVLMHKMMYYAYRASIELGEEKGNFEKFNREKFEQSPYVKMMMADGLEFTHMRNVELLSIAPSGSLSTQISKPVFSYGVEPAFGLYYWKRTRISGKYEYYFIVPNVVYEILKNNGIDLKEKGLTSLVVKDTFDGLIGKSIAKIIDDNKHLFKFKQANELNPMDKVKLMSVLAKYVDSSISTTFILNENATIKDVNNIVMAAWKGNIKSISIYRDSTRYGIVEFIPFKDRIIELYNNGHTLGEYELSPEDVDLLGFNPFAKQEKIVKYDDDSLARIYKFRAENDKFYVILKLDNSEIFITNYKIENRSNEHLLAISNRLGKLIKEKDEKKYYKQLERAENVLNRFTRMLSTALKMNMLDEALDILDEYSFVGNLAWYLTHKIFKRKKKGMKCPVCGSSLIEYAGCFKCSNLSCSYEKCE